MKKNVCKTGVARNFSGATQSYEDWADAQRTIATNLVRYIPDHGFGAIADLGCGTGLLTELLCQRFKYASLHCVDIAPGMVDHCRKRFAQSRFSFEKADLENYSFTRSVDLVSSSCTFQWLANCNHVFQAAAEGLSENGILGMALLVEGTLSELEQAWQSTSDEAFPGLSYHSEEYYKNCVEEAGLTLVTAISEGVVCRYSSGINALKSFKGIGATFRYHNGYSPLTTSQTRAFVKSLENNFRDENGTVALTYKTLYLIAEKRL